MRFDRNLNMSEMNCSSVLLSSCPFRRRFSTPFSTPREIGSDWWNYFSNHFDNLDDQVIWTRRWRQIFLWLFSSFSFFFSLSLFCFFFVSIDRFILFFFSLSLPLFQADLNWRNDCRWCRRTKSFYWWCSSSPSSLLIHLSAHIFNLWIV